MERNWKVVFKKEIEKPETVNENSLQFPAFRYLISR